MKTLYFILVVFLSTAYLQAILPHSSEPELGQTTCIACELIIDELLIGDCVYGLETGNTSKSIIAVFVDWIDLPNGDMISVTFQGEQKYVYAQDETCPNFVSFVVEPDGNTYDLVLESSSGNCPILTRQVVLPENCDPPICQTSLNTGGKIFADYNGNGIQDVSEFGIDKIPVKIYGNDQLLSQTTSSANGVWAVDNIVSGIPIRVEFDVPEGLFDGGRGAESNTRIQITQSGNCDLSLGIYSIQTFADEDPWIATSYFSKGNAPDSNSVSSLSPTIVLNRYSTPEGPPLNGPDGNYYVASVYETGSVWGLSYQKETNNLFSSAFLKRQARWGPHGLGAIYKTDLDDFLPNPTSIPDYKYYGQTSLLLNLDDFGIETGEESSITRNISETPFEFSHDSEVFDLIGKWGLGDMDINSEGDTLFVVNLYSKSLLLINIGNPLRMPITSDRITEIPIPDPGCSDSDDWRPWGLKYHQGKIYVGGVCSAESSQDPDDLWAFVYSWDGQAFKNEVDFSLNYSKGPIAGINCTNFEPWSPDFRDYNVGNNQVCAPTPILSDIEFDSDDNMILGLGDRFGYQTGGSDYGPEPNDLTNYISFSGGDILKLYKLNGHYLLEKNATSGFYTSQGENNNQGVCGGEFYYEDAFFDYHKESALGALAVHPSYNTVVSTMMDPASIWSNGWSQLDNTEGKKNVSYSVFAGASGTFGKAAGLGDIELLVGSTSEGGVNVAIGNYVWIDEDTDGIQDPSENAVPNIRVWLLDSDGLKLDSTLTDLEGYYYFDGVLPNTEHYITLGEPDDYSGDNLLINNLSYVPTSAFVRRGFGNEHNDSNAKHLSGNVPAALLGAIGLNVTTGQSNENDFSLDFGLMPCVNIGHYDMAIEICERDSTLFLDRWFSRDQLQDTIYLPGAGFMACDSIIYVQVELLEESSGELTTNICPGEIVQIGIEIFSESRLTGIVSYDGLNVNGCDSFLSVNVNVLEESLASIDTVLCPGEFLKINSTVFNEFNLLGSIRYSGMNVNGCDSILNVSLSYPSNFLDIQSYYEIDYGDSVMLEPYWQYDFNQFDWTPNDNLSCNVCPYPWASPLETTDYFLSGLDIYGCPYVTNTRVIVDRDKSIYIPNAFSPNGDDLNDFFTVYANPFLEIIEELKIYDRWGDFIIEINDIIPNDEPLGWDGSFHGKAMNPAVFAYIARVRWKDGERETFHGDVTLIR